MKGKTKAFTPMKRKTTALKQYRKQPKFLLGIFPQEQIQIFSDSVLITKAIHFRSDQFKSIT